MSEKKSKTGSREQEAGSSNSFGTGDLGLGSCEGKESNNETIEKVPKAAQERIRRICRQWRREIRDRQRRKYIRRSIEAVISTALSHIDRLETFDPIEPPDHIKNFLKKANIFTLQGVFSEVLLNLFARYQPKEDE